MALTLRGVVVLLTGTVFGFGLALSSTVWHTFMARAKAEPAAAVDPSIESAALVAEVIDRVRREYVDKIDDKRIVEAAIRGIVADLDQHSTFLDADEYEDIRISTTGNYTGVGLDVNLEGGKVTVVAPIDGAPAERAGILPGDVVSAVDDVPVSAEDVASSVARMRGEAGTTVTLDVQRAGSDTPLKFALTRAELHVKTVQSEYLGNGLGYVRLSSFAESTEAELEQATHDLTAAAGRDELLGLVLDLRSNPGGLLDSAVQVADAFLDSGVIVTGTGRMRKAQFEQTAKEGDALEGVPTVVLVNAASASASEIVAGALQDHQRARIVGEKTYGKGSVQTVMPLGEGIALKLTTSRYLTPSGRSINGTGIQPDVVVHADDANRQYRGANGRVALRDDPQLLEALRLISYDSITLTQVQ
ncbi:MAG TPA: S41 family peptidase [Gammaproteobacteria bacterium]|jgi:carboxyl-terminal processing protease|nr:S41 family peptidase [Gammaproteobacteria bacterium]